MSQKQKFFSLDLVQMKFLGDMRDTLLLKKEEELRQWRRKFHLILIDFGLEILEETIEQFHQLGRNVDIRFLTWIL